MSTCFLCLQEYTEFNNYIPKNSTKWLKLNIISTIEKHFWPIVNMKNILGICHLCWSKVNEFHKFYRNIEEVHHKYSKMSFEEEEEEMLKNNCSLEKKIFQLSSPQFLRANYTSTEDSNLTMEEIEDIKVEETFNEDASLLCIATTIMSDCNPISTEKRKRGRPRKKCNINETLTKKPKGKRGRPRKYMLDIHDKHACRHETSANYRNTSEADLIYQPNYAHEQEMPHQRPLAKAISRVCQPNVKRTRGRPRKVQISKEPHSTTNAIAEVAIPNNQINVEKQCSTVQVDEAIKGVPLNLNQAKKLVHKKRKFSSLLKKRKRIQQHKALMRNYIATSVRCMKFFKKNKNPVCK